MPIYTYRCTECGVQFDKQQKFSDQPLKRCPECAKNSLQKVFQPVGIVFKGSGFYATDHRSPSGSASRNTKSGEGEKSNDTDSKSTESNASTDSNKPSTNSEA